MQYLADMGAEVIKIEPPNGAFERHWAGADRATVGDVSALFLCANRNVRSLAIDLKRREAADVVFKLIEQSHVLAENFRPRTLDRLGFGSENQISSMRQLLDSAQVAHFLTVPDKICSCRRCPASPPQEEEELRIRCRSAAQQWTSTEPR